VLILKVYPPQQSRNNEQPPINNMPFSLMPNAVKTQEQIQSSQKGLKYISIPKMIYIEMVTMSQSNRPVQM